MEYELTITAGVYIYKNSDVMIRYISEKKKESVEWTSTIEVWADYEIHNLINALKVVS